nr:trehalose-phosphatase [uncultured Psychrobacter sp.]
MTSGRSVPANSPLIISPIYVAPHHFADYLSHQQRYCLFLDIDGTLADFTLNPKDSFIPATTLTLLQNVQSHGVKIAAVTGRSLAEAKQMLAPLSLPIAATHGLEIDFEDNDFTNNTSVSSVDSAELAIIKQALIRSCLPYDDFIIEDKPYSVALHYRQNPTFADIAYRIITTIVQSHTDWIVKQGKYVWEIAPKDADKGSAILTLLKQFQANNRFCPIFIGDDITDETGFMAVQGDKHMTEKSRFIQNNEPREDSKLPIKGMGMKVGYDGTEPTCAHYYVNNIFEVTVLLESFLKFCQQRPTLSSKLSGLTEQEQVAPPLIDTNRHPLKNTTRPLT